MQGDPRYTGSLPRKETGTKDSPPFRDSVGAQSLSFWATTFLPGVRSGTYKLVRSFDEASFPRKPFT